MAGINESLLLQGLAKQASTAGLQLVVLEQVDSTNLEAKRRLRDGAEAPLLVVADQQTAGQGRRGRSWLSEPGACVLFTLAVPFAAPAEQASAAGLCFMAGVCECLQKGFGLPLELKWPNDLVSEKGKVSGFLGEVLPGAGGSPPHLILGLGLNVTLDKAAMDVATGRAVASLNDLKPGVTWEREELLQQILWAGLSWLQRFQDQGLPALLPQLSRLLAHAPGDAMEVMQDDETLRGSFAGLSDQGHLRLRIGPDAVIDILAGDIG